MVDYSLICLNDKTEEMRFVAHDKLCMHHFDINSELEFLILLAGTKFYEYVINANIRGNNDVESILSIT